jgi:hypothetical protein
LELIKLTSHNYAHFIIGVSHTSTGTRYTPNSNTIKIMSAGKAIYKMRACKNLPLALPT